MTEFCIVLTTTNAENARQIADRLVKERYAACVQMLPMNSVYEWEGEVCHDEETLLFIKTRASLFAPVRDMIQSIHAYEVPEIVSLSIEDGNKEYLQWILTRTK